MLKFISLKIKYLNEVFWGEKEHLRTQNDVFFWDYKPKGMKNEKGGRGVIKLEKWADIVYRWPLQELTFI